jgi:multidrug efflux pump subunit AcrA (membrane-fusion protein)
VANIVRNSLAGAAMMALGLTLAACGSGEGDSKDKAAAAARSASQTVTAATAVLINQPRSVTASGTVSAWEEVPVGAETGGLTAIGVYVEEGTYVRQGQLLVKLNDEVLQAQLRQQEAGVASAEANAAREDAALARAEELRGRGFLSQASLDSATANQRSARAQLSAAQAALSETRTRLNQTSIRAPVAGLISSRSVTRGQIVQPGTELFRMVRDGRLELDAEIPEAELRLVRSGMTALRFHPAAACVPACLPAPRSTSEPSLPWWCRPTPSCFARARPVSIRSGPATPCVSTRSPPGPGTAHRSRS